MEKIYTKGNYLYIDDPDGNRIMQPKKDVIFLRKSNSGDFYLRAFDGYVSKKYNWTDFTKEDGSPFGSLEEFETFITENTGNFSSGSGGGGDIDPGDYDLAAFKNQSSDPFVRGSDLSGKADLVGGKVPAAQLPSYVDDVIEGDTFDDFPATGEQGKIYVDLDTNKIYRWSGSAYIDISQSETLQSVMDRGNTTNKPFIFVVKEIDKPGMSLYYEKNNENILFTDTDVNNDASHSIIVGKGNNLKGIDTVAIGNAIGATSDASDIGSTIVGNNAYNNAIGSTNNTVYGYSCLQNAKNSGDNTIIGYNSANTSSAGGLTANIVIGSNAGKNLGESSRSNIIIGNNTDFNNAQLNNKLYIGGDNSANPVIEQGLLNGDISAGWLRINNKLGIGLNGSTVPSEALVVSGNVTVTGNISTQNNGDSIRWNASFPTNHANALSAAVYQGSMLALPSGCYAASVSGSSASLPFSQPGGLISFGSGGAGTNVMCTRILGARDNSDNLWFQSGNGTGTWRQLASRDWVNSKIGVANPSAYRNITSATTISSADYTLHITGTGSFTQALESANGIMGRVIQFVNESSGLVTLQGSGAELVGPSNTYNLPSGGSVELKSTGSKWIITSKS